MPMLLGNKKTQKNNQNWCIILSPLKNEIDKKKVSQKISEVFSLSTEEAMDLVTNTPIILLDNLTQQVAVQVKEYFRSTGAEMVLTSDVFVKRKCYRTVWPNEPNLSFLRDWNRAPKPSESAPELEASAEEVMETDDAIHEIRSLSDDARRIQDEPVQMGHASDVPAPVISHVDEHRLMEEIRRLKEETAELKEQKSQLRLQLEQMRAQKQSEVSVTEAQLKEAADLREREIQETRGLLANAEEKYEILKNEYREARGVYEDKLSQADDRNQEDEKLIQGLRNKLSVLEDEKRRLFENLSRKEEELAGVRRQGPLTAGLQKLKGGSGEEETAELQAKIDGLTREVETLKITVRERDARVQELREKNEESQRLLGLHAEQGLQTKHALEGRDRELAAAKEAQLHAEEQLRLMAQENVRAKVSLDQQVKQFREKAEALARDAETFKQKLNEMTEDNRLLNGMLEDQKKALLRHQKDYDERRASLEGELSLSRTEVERLRGRLERLGAETEQQVKDYSALKEAYDEQQARCADLEKENDKTRHLLQSRVDQDTREIERLKSEFHAASVQMEAAQKMRQDLEAKVKEQQAQTAYWRHQIENSSAEIKALKQNLADEKSLREQLEVRQRDAEKSQIRLLQEIETRAEEARRWEAEAKSLAGKSAETALKIDELQKALQGRVKDLEAREKELEIARRQLREINAQMEQRDALQRRNQLAAQLAEKEEQLKRMVKQQERVEVEIREREENMRGILADQEKVEKDIVECKQAYRHLMEQAKKEQRPGKIKISRAGNGNGHAPENQENYDNGSGAHWDDRTPTQ